MRDLTIMMDMEVGRPAAMLKDLQDHDHTISAGCLFPRLGGRVAHVAVPDEDVEEVTSIIRSHGGVVADDRPCVVVPADHEGGPVAAASAVAEAGVAVQIAYFGARGEVVMATADIDTALTALGLD